MSPELRVYKAELQPATRFLLAVPGKKKRVWFRNKAKRRLPAQCCRKLRLAANLDVAVYDDGIWFFCKDGKGCKVGHS